MTETPAERHARGAHEEADRAAVYARKATIWAAASIALILISQVTLIVAIVGRHFGWWA